MQSLSWLQHALGNIDFMVKLILYVVVINLGKQQNVSGIYAIKWLVAGPVSIRLQKIVTRFAKIDHLRASTEIHFLPVHERYIHALFRNTKHQTIDCQVCFYRWLFIDAVKRRGCISWSLGALIGLYGVLGCSSRQSWPPLWIVSVCATN